MFYRIFLTANIYVISHFYGQTTSSEGLERVRLTIPAFTFVKPRFVGEKIAFQNHQYFEIYNKMLTWITSLIMRNGRHELSYRIFLCGKRAYI